MKVSTAVWNKTGSRKSEKGYNLWYRGDTMGSLHKHAIPFIYP